MSEIVKIGSYQKCYAENAISDRALSGLSENHKLDHKTKVMALKPINESIIIIMVDEDLP